MLWWLKRTDHHFSAMLFSNTLPKNFQVSCLSQSTGSLSQAGWRHPESSSVSKIHLALASPQPFPISARAELGQHCELLWQSRPELTQPVLVNSERSWNPLTWAASCSHQVPACRRALSFCIGQALSDFGKCLCYSSSAASQNTVSLTNKPLCTLVCFTKNTFPPPCS